MENNVKFTLLYDIYGKLLTKKQQDIFEEYYLYNLSLREVASNKNISYQAVRDSIKTSEEMLEEYEKKVSMLKLKQKLSKIEKICSKDNKLDKNEILRILSEDDI